MRHLFTHTIYRKELEGNPRTDGRKARLAPPATDAALRTSPPPKVDVPIYPSGRHRVLITFNEIQEAPPIADIQHPVLIAGRPLRSKPAMILIAPSYRTAEWEPEPRDARK